MVKIIIYFPTSGTLCVFLWHYSKWIVCFFEDLYCTELDLQRKFRVSNKTLVSIDIEEFWYRTCNITINIEEFWYRTSTTSVAYCASTVNCVLCEYYTYNTT